jgi:hypothetical protein
MTTVYDALPFSCSNVFPSCQMILLFPLRVPILIITHITWHVQPHNHTNQSRTHKSEWSDFCSSEMSNCRSWCFDAMQVVSPWEVRELFQSLCYCCMSCAPSTVKRGSFSLQSARLPTVTPGKFRPSVLLPRHIMKTTAGSFHTNVHRYFVYDRIT